MRNSGNLTLPQAKTLLFLDVVRSKAPNICQCRSKARDRGRIVERYMTFDKRLLLTAEKPIRCDALSFSVFHPRSSLHSQPVFGVKKEGEASRYYQNHLMKAWTHLQVVFYFSQIVISREEQRHKLTHLQLTSTSKNFPKNGECSFLKTRPGLYKMVQW